MGFKDLFSFDMSLLRKTAWKVLNNSDELWVLLLRGLYFLDGDLPRQEREGKHLGDGAALLRERRRRRKAWYGV